MREKMDPIASSLRKVIDKYGCSVLNNPTRLYNFLMDLVPNAKKEVKLIREIVSVKGVITRLIDVSNLSAQRQNQAIQECLILVQEETVFIKEDALKYALMQIAAALGMTLIEDENILKEETVNNVDMPSHIVRASIVEKNTDALPRNIEVGDTLKFGRYRKSDNPENIAETLEWLVLSKEKYKALLISKHAVDYLPYNAQQENTTWESCTLRKWLNCAFLFTSFNQNEISRILTTTVNAEKNPKFGSDPGRSTLDKIFLLSANEADVYFPSNLERVCFDEHFGWWWLRSPGRSCDYAAYVNVCGSICYVGDGVSYESVAVRPALWLGLE